MVGYFLNGKVAAGNYIFIDSDGEFRVGERYKDSYGKLRENF